MYFHPKLAWPPATYDVIARNHSNWSTVTKLVLSSLREGWMNSYWKRQVLMFYSLGKNSEKPYLGWPTSPPGRFFLALEVGAKKRALGTRLEGGISPFHSTLLLVRPRVKRFYCLFWSILNGVTLKTSNSIPSHNGKLDFKKRTHEK